MFDGIKGALWLLSSSTHVEHGGHGFVHVATWSGSPTEEPGEALSFEEVDLCHPILAERKHSLSGETALQDTA